MIEASLAHVRGRLNVPMDPSWTEGYYQAANRLAHQGEQARDIDAGPVPRKLAIEPGRFRSKSRSRNWSSVALKRGSSS